MPSESLLRMVKPPGGVNIQGVSVFLAGSIEQNNASKWQDELLCSYSPNSSVTVFNPRRDDWDSSWKSDMSFGPFRQQVNWELDYLGQADVIAMYFEPGTKSAISLLELGLYCSTGRMVVCCPHGFWHRGNVEIVCTRYNVPFFDTFDEFRQEVVRRLEDAMQRNLAKEGIPRDIERTFMSSEREVTKAG
ncbi:hypothetical protein V8E54_009358 [Elaphomyces granulatus]